LPVITRRRLLGAATALALTGCGRASPATSTTPRTPEILRAAPGRDEWPLAVRSAGPSVLAAYRFAAARPDLLAWMPCFCGCGAQGHRSNLDCFIDARDVDAVVLDPHGIGCGTCVAVALQTQALDASGLDRRSIRAAIDAQWAKSGPPTDTPLPPA
jgi:hypothetical protein